jgi:MFS superfamily sulfate permease-like transporter
VGVAAIVVFLVTAGRAIAGMGPRPDGTCATAPTCPNTHQWVALLVLAAACIVLALLTIVAIDSRRRWPGVAIAVAVALAIVIVNPPGHLNSPHADWFGRSLSDGTLD